MGLEARCPERVHDAGGDRAGAGHAVLETDEPIVRAEAGSGVRARVPRAAITHVSVGDGVLHVRWAGGALELTLGAAAKAAGLTYTKVTRVSDTHTAEKLVRPRSA